MYLNRVKIWWVSVLSHAILTLDPNQHRFTLSTVSSAKLMTLCSPWPSCKKWLKGSKTWTFLRTSEPCKWASGKSRPSSSFTFCQGGRFTALFTRPAVGATSGSRSTVQLSSSVILDNSMQVQNNRRTSEASLDSTLSSGDGCKLWCTEERK